MDKINLPVIEDVPDNGQALLRYLIATLGYGQQIAVIDASAPELRVFVNRLLPSDEDIYIKALELSVVVVSSYMRINDEDETTRIKIATHSESVPRIPEFIRVTLSNEFVEWLDAYRRRAKKLGVALT